MRKAIHNFAVPVLVALASAPSVASTVVYSQPVSSTLSAATSQLVTGSTSLPVQTFDDFTLGDPKSITDVHWAGGCFGGEPFLSSCSNITGFRIEFWTGLNAPTTQVKAESFGISSVKSTLGASNLFSYDVDLASAFDAVAGTKYWLSILAVTSQLSPQWGWAAGTGGDGFSYQVFPGVSSGPITSDRAFSLTSPSASVPEPGSLALTALALLAVGAAARARKPR